MIIREDFQNSNCCRLRKFLQPPIVCIILSVCVSKIIKCSPSILSPPPSIRKKFVGREFCPMSPMVIYKMFLQWFCINMTVVSCVGIYAPISDSDIMGRCEVETRSDWSQQGDNGLYTMCVHTLNTPPDHKMLIQVMKNSKYHQHQGANHRFSSY